MCTLAIYYRSFAGYPVVVAANRDEFLARPALPPTLLCADPRIVGGKDLQANGTWLGISEHGIVAGLLNRRNGDTANDSTLRSRGLLCLDALKQRTAADAAAFVARQRGGDYNPFNLLIASRDSAFVAYNRFGKIEVVELSAGFHLLTNLDIDDFECPRISRSYNRFAELGDRAEFARDPVANRAALGALLADHSTQLNSAIGKAQFALLASRGLRHTLVKFDLHEAWAIARRSLLCGRCTLRRVVRAYPDGTSLRGNGHSAAALN